MSKKIEYSTRVTEYYKFGGSLSKTITDSSLDSLLKQIKDFKNKSNNVVYTKFSPIEETTIVKSDGKGYVIFNDNCSEKEINYALNWSMSMGENNPSSVLKKKLSEFYTEIEKTQPIKSKLPARNKKGQFTLKLPKVCTFKYKNDLGFFDERYVKVISIDDIYVKGYDLQDKNQFKQFLRSKIYANILSPINILAPINI